MGKITRALGNLVAFASSATGTDRTIFGSLTQSDDLTDNISTEFKEGWGIIGPSDKPPLEDFNGAMFTHGQLLAYLHQMGVAEWDGDQEFQIGSISNSNGTLYSCLTADHVSATPPESDPANWLSLYSRTNLLDNAKFVDWSRGSSFSPSTIIVTSDRWRVRGVNFTGGSTTIDKISSDSYGSGLRAVTSGHTDSFYISEHLDIYDCGAEQFSLKDFTLSVDSNFPSSVSWGIDVSISTVADGSVSLLTQADAKVINAGRGVTSFSFSIPDLSPYTLDANAYITFRITSSAALPSGSWDFIEAQLERGRAFSGFEQLPLAINSQRNKRMTQTFASSSVEKMIATGWRRAADAIEFTIPSNTVMRITPSANFSDFTMRARGGGASITLSAVVAASLTDAGIRCTATAVGSIASEAYIITIAGSGILVLDSEL